MWWDGKKVSSPRSNFGAIGNAHHIKFGENNPWNSTFEPVFDRADTEFPDLANWLMTLEANTTSPNAPFQDRFMAQALSRERRRQVAAGLSSLIVRSPRSRNNIRLTVEYYLQRFGVERDHIDKTLIAGNMRANHQAFTEAIDGGGKFVVLISDASEFIWGDGFLHNFPTNSDRPLSPRCVVPILPTVTVLFVQPTMYRTQSELLTIRLSKNEVAFFNKIVQIYSCEHVFFRNDEPQMIEEFSRHEHLKFINHAHKDLDRLVECAVGFLPQSHR